MKKAPDIPSPRPRREVCPDYCPFLQKEAFYCRLFAIQLICEKPLIYKCNECLNADVRKSVYKNKVKDFEKRQYMWDKAIKRKPLDLWGKIKTSFADWKDRKEFKEFMSAMSGDLPILLDKKTSKLLLNLYLVLDSTEKQIMKDILINPQTAEIFINKIKSMGARTDLLKQVRKEMDNIVFKHQKEHEQEEAQRRLQRNTIHNFDR